MANDFFSVHELETTEFDVMEFTGEWEECLGKPEKAGTWLIYGESYNGKTGFVLQLVKYMTHFVKHKILINSLEEGKTESFKLAIRRTNLSVVGNKILLGNRVPMPKVKERLRKQRSPEIVVIDSLQYADLNRKTYKALKNEFPNKLFIFVSHADGKVERGALAKHIRNDAHIKIRVEGFKAFPESRFGGNKPYVINHEKAAQYHGEIK